MNFKKRIMLIGVDGASYKMINPLIKSNHLPNLKRFKDDGSTGTLNSNLPIHSLNSWSSILTGKNPGKHGVYDVFDRFDGHYRKRIIDKSNLKAKTIWQYLDLFNLKSVIVNLPVTYPPSPLNGVMISGMLTTPNQMCTYPCHLNNELKASGYKIDLFRVEGESPSSYYESAIDIMSTRHQTFVDLLLNTDWDFSAIDYTSISRFQQKFWNQDELIQGLYRKMDTLLGDLLDRFDDGRTTFLFFSDHGYKSIEKKFFVNEWLWEKGYLSRNINTKPATFPDFWDELFSSNQDSKMIEQILAKLKITKDNIGKLLPDLFIETLKHVSPMKLRKAFPRENLIVDWKNTKAYFLSEQSQGININLKDREPHGIVKPGFEYERLRDDIIRELYRLRDPHTFKNVIDVVFRREELYHGDALEFAPDIIFAPRNYEYLPKPSKRTSRLFIGSAKDLYPVYSAPCPDGIFMAFGPQIKRDGDLDRVSQYDIAPTVLSLLGLPLPKDFDGEPMHHILKDNDYYADVQSSYNPQASLVNIDKDKMFERTNAVMSAFMQ